MGVQNNFGITVVKLKKNIMKALVPAVVTGFVAANEPNWVEVYSQKSNNPTAIFLNCNIDSCNEGQGENFINFDLMKGLPKYHFKLVWDNGNPDQYREWPPSQRSHSLEWIQDVNPLLLSDEDASPREVRLLPTSANETPFEFKGLSLS